MIATLARAGYWRGLPESAVALVAGVTLTSITTFAAMPMIAVFLQSERAFAAGEIALVLSLYFVANHVSPLVLGPWSDRVSRYRFGVAGLALRAIGFVGFFFAEDVFTVTAAAILIGIGGAAFTTAAFGLFAGLPHGQREHAVVVANIGQNAGVFVGPLIGAGIALLDQAIPFLVSGVLSIATAALGWGAPRLVVGRSPTPPWKGMLTPLRNRDFLLLSAVMMPWFVLFPQIYVTMPLAVSELGGHQSWANAVFVVNGAVGLAMLITIGRILERGEPMRLILVCYATALASFALGIGAASLWVLLAAIALFSLVEVVILPAAEIVVMRQAPPDQGGAYFGMFTAMFGVGGAAGQAVGSSIAIGISIGAGWTMMIAVAAVGTVLAAARLVVLRRARTTTAQARPYAP